MHDQQKMLLMYMRKNLAGYFYRTAKDKLLYFAQEYKMQRVCFQLSLQTLATLSIMLNVFQLEHKRILPIRR